MRRPFQRLHAAALVFSILFSSYACGCVIRYSGSEGLANYIGSHLTAMTLALFLKCDVRLPPGMMRPEYAEKTSWYLFPSDWVFDLAPLQRLFRSEGLQVLRPDWAGTRLYGVYPYPKPFYPVETQPWAPYPYDRSPNVTEFYIPRDHNRMMDEVLHEMFRAFNVSSLPELRKALRGREVDLGFTLLLGAIPTHMRNQFDAAFEALTFTPFIHHVAGNIADHMQRISAHWHGMHLRVEADYVKQAQRDAVLKEYVDMMRDTGFSGGTAIYVAGSYTSAELETFTKYFSSQGVAGKMVSKASFMDAAMFAALPSEVTAAIDFLVLVKSYRFLGYGQSSFSFFVSQIRKLNPQWTINRNHKVLKTRVYEVLNDHYSYEGHLVAANQAAQ